MIQKKIGVIGAGSFGTVIANLIAKNADVLIYAKYAHQVEAINQSHSNRGYDMAKNIVATNRLQEVADACDVIFPVVPSAGFRDLMKSLSPFVGPRHILIHCTKGLDFDEEAMQSKGLSKDVINTMSDVICQETSVLRVGCVSGPNLAKEIMAGLPTATVIASEFEEVLRIGHQLLSNDHFFCFASKEMRGAEFAGSYKNIIALAGGMLHGLQLGKNLQALLVTRGLREMIYFGKAVGIPERAFLGTAGLGDLIATATSEKSRNFRFGVSMTKGLNVQDVLNEEDEVVEGVRTLKIAYGIGKFYGIKAPITNMLYRVIYENYAIEDAIRYLMSYPYSTDVDF